MNFIEGKKFFISALLLIVIFECLSLLGYKFIAINNVFFWLILIFVFAISLKNLSAGLLVVLTELFIGSKGYLFSFSLLDFEFSIRIGLFITIFLVFIIKLITKKIKLEIKKSNFYYPLIILSIFLLWAIINGLLNQNLKTDIFLDANAFFYFFYAIIFFEVIKDEKIISKIILILAASLITVGIKTLIFFIVYAYQPLIDIPLLYHWIRNTGIGEITHVNQNIYRIFFQAHIYSLIGFFIVFAFVTKNYLKQFKSFSEKQINIFLILTSIISSLSVIICFSRSNWVGGLMAFVFLIAILLFYFKIDVKNILKTVSLFLLIIIFNMVFLYIISGNFSASLIKNRISNLTEESAGISRLNQLQPLSQNIKENLIIGAGFGKTVTYKTDDPRILKNNPNGWYTTYAFEWGYLDLLLKLGLVGFVFYLYLIYKIILNGLKLLKMNLLENQKLLITGLLTGLIAIIFTNIFSPYLNHPLGIGYLILTMVIFNFYETTQRKINLN